ncbi:MAG: uracil phosphoribosyltransferase [Aquificaceae bacterium]
MVRQINHPIILHKLGQIREKSTSSEDLRRLLEDITFMALVLMFEKLNTEKRSIKTPMEEAIAEFIDEERLVFVPILRAGLPMLNGSLKLFPKAKAGFLAIKRDEETLQPTLYYSRLPELKGKTALILDPMLATGGTVSIAIQKVKKESPKELLTLHIVSSPEGVKHVEKEYPDVLVNVISVDEALTPNGYIIPGVGDIGNRLYY